MCKMNLNLCILCISEDALLLDVAQFMLETEIKIKYINP